MNKIITVLFFQILLPFVIKAQENPVWRFSTDPTHLLVNNFGIKVERQINKKTFGLYIGVKVASAKTAKLSAGSNVGSGYSFGNFSNRVNNGITIGINNRYYVNDPVIGFIDFSMFYRHWWIKDKYLEFDNVEGGSSPFKGVRNESQDIYGFKFLIGETFTLSQNGKFRPFIDLATGIGVRLKTGVFETFNGEINNVRIQYNRYTSSEWWPSIHIGVNIGFAIYPKPVSKAE